MTAQHARVCMVEDRGLDPPAEQLVGLAHEELVEAVLARDQHREPAAAAAGASPLLAQRRNRAREADRDHAVEQADVDAELERIRRRDAEQLAVLQPALDVAALLRGVAGPVRRELRVVAEPLGGEPVDQLGRLAALRERQRPQAALDEHRLQTRRLGERRAAQPELRVLQRRIPEHDGALRARRRVVADDRHLFAEQRGRELARVRDRRGGEQELRLGAVDARQPAQAAEDVRDMRAEHAAVDVRFVDDDVAEVREHVAPAVVVRQQADVDHVGVRQDHVRPLADLPALLGRRVAVVDRRLQPRYLQLGQRAELVLRERLRRVEVERARSSARVRRRRGRAG